MFHVKQCFVFSKEGRCVISLFAVSEQKETGISLPVSAL